MKDIEFYINEKGIACVTLKDYNDSLEEIERLHNIIKEVREEIQFIDIESYLIKHEDLKKFLEILDKENK